VVELALERHLLLLKPLMIKPLVEEHLVMVVLEITVVAQGEPILLTMEEDKDMMAVTQILQESTFSVLVAVVEHQQ
tara:strand:+ start:74 stop:301 length:228 start_codon:yes stop_codon:yes gene_type:complete